MDFDSSNNSDAHYTGKIKTQTFKQLKLERLIKEGKVMPASKLAEAKELELQRIRDFERAAEDEQRHRRTASPAHKDNSSTLPLTRERIEE